MPIVVTLFILAYVAGLVAYLLALSNKEQAAFIVLWIAIILAVCATILGLVLGGCSWNVSPS